MMKKVCTSINNWLDGIYYSLYWVSGRQSERSRHLRDTADIELAFLMLYIMGIFIGGIILLVVDKPIVPDAQFVNYGIQLCLVNVYQKIAVSYYGKRRAAIIRQFKNQSARSNKKTIITSIITIYLIYGIGGVIMLGIPFYLLLT